LNGEIMLFYKNLPDKEEIAVDVVENTSKI
jgi:hypothetical protein